MGLRGTSLVKNGVNLNSRNMHVVQQVTTDVLEQADVMPLWSQDYTQLGKGAFSGSISSITYSGLQVFRETMNRAVDAIANAPADTYVIGLSTLMDGDSSWGLLPVKSNSLITVNKNSELFFRTSTLSEIVATVISAQRLEEYAAQVEWVDLPKMMENVRPVDLICPSTSSHLLTLLADGPRQILQHSDTDSLDSMWNHYENDLLATCLQALMGTKENPKSYHDYRIHRYIVNRVRELTLSNVDSPLTISELCTHLRISRRTLNHAFVRVIGITPVAYMRNIRLNRVRRELKSKPHQITSIASVAIKWGFWHMSLFSRYYRELFGECPMETLIRCRSEKHANSSSQRLVKI